MYRKIVIAIGAIAIIFSLINPINETKEIPLTREQKWSMLDSPRTKTITDYRTTTARTIAIAVGAAALFFVVPNKK